MLAWLVGEDGTFETSVRVGISAVKAHPLMFGIPIEKYAVNSELWQKGKMATPSCWYGGQSGSSPLATRALRTELARQTEHRRRTHRRCQHGGYRRVHNPATRLG